MSQWQHIQRDFSGGEISDRMLMRADTEVYKKSLLEMRNFMPMPQGSAKRMPGTRFYQELANTEARIIPFLTSGNERSLLLLTPESLTLVRNVADRLDGDANISNVVVDEVEGKIFFRRNIVRNQAFVQGERFWVLTPEKYTGVNGDGPLGAYIEFLDNGADLVLRPRLYRYPAQEAALVTTTGSANVTFPTDRVNVRFSAAFVTQPAPVAGGGYELKITISANADFSDPLVEQTYNEVTHPTPGTNFQYDSVVDLPTAGWTGALYIKFSAEARATATQPYSNPYLIVRFLEIDANFEAELGEATVSTPYVAADLQDVHFVQSPYADKELVLTHPKHAPRKFYFKTSPPGYVLETIAFSNGPSAWAVNNYPAACTSYLGRLVLAGGQTFRTTTGDPVATVSETVWMTEVGEWDTFTASPSDPADSIEFTAVYRSPIQWVYGQRSLLVGALEYEYSAVGEGILAPGDLAVYLQSTHGSNNVQPAAFGEALLFPADGGTKVRSLMYRRETDGWVSDDLTLLNPSICLPGIVRMIRLRNPHQMCVVLKGDGTLAIFHSESNLNGWSRYILDGGFIKDICVVPDEAGLDVLFLTVQRTIDGVEKLYLECIPNWRESEVWDYNSCTSRFTFDAPTSVIDGLEYLEGKIVQVSSQGKYLGFYRVTGGGITLFAGEGLGDDYDEVILHEVTRCTIGLGHRASIKTLPPEKMDPGARARFVDYSVRVVGSTRPVVNGERPADRNPQSILDASQPLDGIGDVRITTFGHDPLQMIEISEQLPFPCEIIGVYGLMKQGNTT